MRVVHCYRTYSPDGPGGLQEAIRQICIATAKQGVENTVFCLSKKPIPRQLDGVECRTVRCRSWAAPASCDLGGVSAFRTFAALTRNADVVHFHFPWPFADLLHWFIGSKVPAIVTYHSDIVRQEWLRSLYSPLMWATLRRMCAIVATSPQYASTSRVLSDPSIKERVNVIPLAIDEHSYPTKGEGTVLKRLGLTGRRYFLSVGVLRYYKGMHTLIAAAKHVQTPIVIAGSGSEGGVLRDLAAHLGVTNVVFAGQVSDTEKVALLENCFALVLPSHLRSEAFGMVLVEAAMFGRPLISCELGTGTSFVNVHQETGLIISPEDVKSLAEAMNHLLADPATARSLGQAARKRYERLFNGAYLGNAYVRLYEEAIQEKHMISKRLR